MKFDKNHPKLTAYALGELNAEEMKQVEEILRQQPELRQEVEAIRALTLSLTEELKAEPALRMSERRRVALERKFARGR